MPTVKNAILAPVPGSNVTAQLQFVESDDGQTLFVSGTANNFAPLGVYITLVYGLQSNADVTPPFTVPGPCVDDQTLGAVLPAGSVIPGGLMFDPSAMTRMLIGVWNVQPTGGVIGLAGNLLRGRGGAGILQTTGTLQVSKSTASPLGVHLNEVNTVSIRRAAPGLSTFNDFRPQNFPLQACGQIM